MSIFEVRDPEFHDVIPKSATLEPIVTGILFGEGPIWHPTEHWLMFSDIISSVQYRWSESTGISLFRRPSNMANGNAFDCHGNIVSCEHGTSRVVRHANDGKVVETLADQYEGKALNSPNDIVCGGDGSIWFTDPTFGRIRPDVGYLRDMEIDVRGIYRIAPDGVLSLADGSFEQPNGICLSLDERQLYVNDSARPAIRKFEILDDGSLSGGDVWTEVVGEAGPRPKWVPDGLKISNDGYVFCNGPGGVYLYSPDARCLGAILFPEKSTNFCFMGPERDQLAVTTAGNVYRLKTHTSGPAMIPTAQI